MGIIGNSPKLPGDKMMLGENEEIIVPIGGIDGLRDEDLPLSAYDQKVPRFIVLT